MHVDLGPLFQRLAIEVAVDAFGGDPGVADGGGQQVRLDDVAAGEHARLAGDLVVLVRADQSALILEFLQAGEIHRLAEGGNQQIAGDVEFGSGLRHHFLVHPIDLDHPQRHGATIRAEHRRDRGDAGHDAHALARHRLDFVFGGRHFRYRPAVGDEHVRAFLLRRCGHVVFHLAENRLFRRRRFGFARNVAEPARHRGHVHRGIAPSHHHDSLAHLVEPPVVEGAQERDAVNDVRGLGAGNRQGTARLCAQADEHGVEVAPQLFQTHVLADLGVEAHLHAHVDNALDLAVEHVARRAIAGNAIAHHAAELRVGVENGAAMALAPELVGAGEPGRPAADDRDLLAGFVFGPGEAEAVRERPLADEMLDRVDADEILDLVAVASGLAWRRAHPPHDRRERVRLGETAERVFLPGDARRRLLDAAHDVEPAANVLARGAATLTGRHRLDVGRAFVSMFPVKDLVLPALPFLVAIAVAAEGQLGAELLRCGRHFSSPRCCFTWVRAGSRCPPIGALHPPCSC